VARSLPAPSTSRSPCREMSSSTLMGSTSSTGRRSISLLRSRDLRYLSRGCWPICASPTQPLCVNIRSPPSPTALRRSGPTSCRRLRHLRRKLARLMTATKAEAELFGLRDRASALCHDAIARGSRRRDGWTRRSSPATSSRPADAHPARRRHAEPARSISAHSPSGRWAGLGRAGVDHAWIEVRGYREERSPPAPASAWAGVSIVPALTGRP